MSLSPSVSTNATELNMIFVKMLGISDTANNVEGIRILGSDNPSIALRLAGFLSKRSVTSGNNNLCQGV